MKLPSDRLRYWGPMGQLLYRGYVSLFNKNNDLSPVWGYSRWTRKLLWSTTGRVQYTSTAVMLALACLLSWALVVFAVRMIFGA